MPKQDTFKIAVRKFAPFETAMQKFWDKFCAISGCNLELEMVVMDLHELYDRTITKKGMASGDFDIAHINTDWIYEGYLNQDFEILNPYINKNKPDDFPRGWSKSLLSLQRFGWEVVGLPFHDGPECLIYRKDLFDSEVEQERYFKQYGKALSIPKTWEEFHQIARFFNRPADHLFGCIFACYPDGHNTVFDYCLQLWTRGGDLLDKSGNVNVDTPASIEGLTFYRSMVNDKNAVHPASAQFDSVGAGLAFMNGEAAMMVNWFGFAAMCEVDKNSKVKGKIDVDVLPSNADQSSASLNVYWLYTIAKGSKHKDLAYDFLRFAIHADNDKLLTLEGGIGCRISTWNDAEINSIIPYYNKLESLHAVAKMLPQKQNWASMAAVIDEMVLSAINSDQEIEEIAQMAQAKINKLV
ncbi:ABC transporter substrate-binding protein [Pedobacter yonginense]|uniref:ABC transporter substrate-binding protein n=1 Tax=Pedobacter yonginense TaxID=651869 RepID=A0A317ESI0_9SPHI|nr:extracellular solute-binding protein [Pedobacter yonginense]PWS28823.1 ABC transporter substrate-binding protein [Pedobacter yonginense]